MSNDLIPTRPSLPEATTVNQTGKTNTYVENRDGGVINMYVCPQKPEYDYSAEKMMAVQSFSKVYYQLLVTCEDDVFNTGAVTVSKDRALSQHYVPPEILERCSSLSDAGIEELKTFPAIICQENAGYRGLAGKDQHALYGYITHVKKDWNNVKVAFRPIGVFNQEILCEKRNAVYFDLTMDCAITDLNRSAWSVHKVNLFDAFKEAGLTGFPMPY